MRYVGQTGRTLQICKKEHMRALTNSDAMTSALVEHAMDTMHEIAWEDAEVLSLVGGGGGGGGEGGDWIFWMY